MSDRFAAREDLMEVQRILLITRAHYQALVDGRKDLGPEWHIEAVTKGINNMSLFLGMAIKHLEEADGTSSPQTEHC